LGLLSAKKRRRNDARAAGGAARLGDEIAARRDERDAINEAIKTCAPASEDSYPQNSLTWNAKMEWRDRPVPWPPPAWPLGRGRPSGERRSAAAWRVLSRVARSQTRDVKARTGRKRVNQRLGTISRPSDFYYPTIETR